MMPSWWRQWMPGAQRRALTGRFTKPRRKWKSVRPCLEALEERCLLAVTLTVGPNVNVGHLAGNQSETTIAIDPTNPAHLFAAANQNSGPGLYVSTSTNGGATWNARIIAGGNDGFASALGDPQAAFDQFGNLFLTYMEDNQQSVQLLLSTNGGQSFNALPAIAVDPEGGRLDKPVLATGPGTTPGSGSVWVSWSSTVNTIALRGAPVTGLGVVGAYTATEHADGSAGGNFGGVAVGPTGRVLVTYQEPTGTAGPSTLVANLDPDGLGPARLGPPITVAGINVGGFRPIPAQPDRTVDAGVNLVWDVSGAHKGRVYLVYEDAPDAVSNDLNIFVRYSDNNGASWSGPVRVNDDATTASQFMPAVALDPTTGYLAVSWYDARNDPGNQGVEVFASASIDGGNTFLPNVQVAGGQSSSITNSNFQNDLGDYTSVAFEGGSFYPIWTDNSSTLPGNADRPNFDIATARVTLNTGTPAGPHFYVSSALTAAPGQAVPLTVVAENANGNTNAAYTGTVSFSSSDPAFTGLPLTYTFTAGDAGRHTFSVVFNTVGNQTVGVTDQATPTMQGATGKVGVVGPLPTGPSTISGTVFLDYNADGVRSGGEPVLPGETVFLDLNGNGALDPGEPSTTTDGNGLFTFNGLAPGIYTLRAAPFGGTVVTAPLGGAYTIALPSGSNASGQNFGEVLISSVAPVQPNGEIFPASPDANTAFVQGAYRNILGRDADAAGLAAWVAQLQRGVSRTQVAGALWDSAEHRGLEVDSYYRNYLHRAADAAGKAAWVGLLQTGTGEANVVVAFLTSAEFQALHLDATNFIQELYRDVLDRQADPGGQTVWLQFLQGSSRAALVNAFVNSAESDTRAVNGFYLAFLQRPGDPAGQQTWVAQLQMGAGFRTVALAFLSSAEYFAGALGSVQPGRGQSL